MKKIMISYASYGGGHLSAAKNLKQYIEENYEDCEVILFDCMKYINKVIDKVYGKTYSTITTDVPWFWGKIYYHTQDPIFEKILSISNKVLSYKLARILKEYNPDIIISTHFFVSHMCAILKKNNKLNAKVATVITDYGDDPYNEWISNHEYIDNIFVAHENMKLKLIEKGVNPNKVYDTGIPISPDFLVKHNKLEIINSLDLNPIKKTILFFGGGELGLGKSKTIDIFEELVKYAKNTQIIAIAGKNENLKNTFEKIVEENNRQNNVRVLGFSTQIAEFMAISNLVVTKPGGLTSTEAIVSSLPIVAINPIPGQEEENAEFIERNDAGIWIKKNDNATAIICDLINDDSRLEQLKNNTIKIAKPNSAKDICGILL